MPLRPGLPRVRAASWAALCAGFAAGCLAVDERTGEPLPDDPEVEALSSAITGGVVAQTCQFPTTVQLAGCTGTLVHPSIVTTAGHCGADHKLAIFGELTSAPARRVAIEFCRVYKRTGAETTLSDWAFCKLATPVTDVPLAPPLMGCETDLIRIGQRVVIAGYGRTEADEGGLGTKRWVETTINRLDTGRGLQVGGNGRAPCYGDSGGPAYVRLGDGSWRTLAIDSSGIGPSCTAGDLMAPLHKAVPWIERESGVDITPCHDANGTWNPTPACRGFSTTPEEAGRQWANGCAERAPSPPSATCGAPFGGSWDAGVPWGDAGGGAHSSPQAAGGSGGSAGLNVGRPTSISGSGAGCTCAFGGSSVPPPLLLGLALAVLVRLLRRR